MSDDEWIEWAIRTEQDQPNPADIGEWEAWTQWVARNQPKPSSPDEVINQEEKQK
jgi:hypothetical protein